MDAIQTLKFENKVLEIFQDENPESPREWDNLGVMICAHKRYSLGDIQIKSEDELKEHLDKAVIALPLNLYDHSGITMSVKNDYPYNDQWDAGQVGYIYVTKDKLLKEFDQKRLSKKLIEKAKRILINEVETYDQYLRGDIYGFMVSELKTCDMNEEHKEHLDSCWGFYGSDLNENGMKDHISDFDKFKEI